MIGNILRQRYRIIKQLGAGGFGETYFAEDLDIPVTPKPVCVVKKLHPEEIDQYTIRLFEQEAQILYQLGQNHNQIPKLYAYFQEGQDFYLVQEFIDGYDLTQEISPGKKLSENDVIQLLRDVLEILVYVHENKVIHRDIKPANIMRRKDGKLVLIDFGIVKQINTTIAMKSGSTSRTISIGTGGYMPIEQAIGKPKYSSDIYALGMTAIQALIDLSPRLLAEDDDGEVLWIDQVEISDKLENFINKMVCYDWRQRYRNAKEALDELNQIFVINQGLLAVPELVPVKLNGKYGYVSGGKLVIPCQFDHASGFSEGIATVKIEKKWGFINTIGKLVIPYQFDNAFGFLEGLATVKIEKKWGFINTDGKLVIPCKFDDAWKFSQGIAVVKIKDKQGYINTNGQVVIDCNFDFAISFSEGIAVVKIKDKWGYINTTGQVIIDCNLDSASSFSEGLAVVKIEGKWGYINTTGQVIIDCNFDFAWTFSEELAVVKIEGKWGYINTNGQVIIDCNFDFAKSFSEGLAMVKIEEKWGFINTIGKLVIPCQFDHASGFSEDLAKVTISGKEHLIDKTGKIVY
ncbi:WG repeat-containing protein [Dolichospermum planctonicum CS-1226]|uniref:WG repeat-containing protein n=1 Tax=Dolichospermum planctonicum CS-1226 TaxID=3021751 RepID=A0ABT5AH39_9CYAN|nr:WG repeat-containing protein [Dolichospermum planctonicum]MDB9536252.1 WG repeat-containing protein [Dolichospermum planctonicum CS-1226]